MRTHTPLFHTRRAAAMLATSLLLGACWSDIKEQGNNDADDADGLPTAYDSAAVPGAATSPVPSASPVVGDSAAAMDTGLRRDSAAAPPPR